MSTASDLRALILAPIGRDATLAIDSLRRAGIEGRVCANVDELAREASAGAGMCLVAEEALATSDLSRLRDALQRQPPWSDLPMLLVIRPDSSIEDVLQALGPLGNVTPLTRPFRIQTLVNTAHTLLRARRRQYESRDMMQRLSESDRRKTEFLALLGHELRNPLAAISASVHLLEHFHEPDRARRALQVIDRQTRNLTRMIDDLLDVSRITSGKIVLRHEPVDLGEVCAHVHQVLEPAARAAKVSLATEVPETPMVVGGDRVRLEQIVCNLVGNAIKYTPEGGTVSLSLSPGDGGVAILRVRDDGIGIAPDMLERIFDPFFQADGATGRSRGGLGLGLALVRDLVHLHRGTVRAESGGDGRGSTFTVTLPLSNENVVERSNGAALAHAPAAAPVLLVEDNADIRELMAAMLESWGYAVQVAAEGTSGVDLARRLAPRIALVDIGLPGIDGYEVARRVRQVLPKDSTRLIAMSGFGQPEDKARALQAGFDAHLVKPVEPDELRQILFEVG